MAYLGFRRFDTFQRKNPLHLRQKVGDRGMVFGTLGLGLLGSLVLIDFNPGTLHFSQVLFGFTLLSISMTLGPIFGHIMLKKLMGL